MGGLTDGPAVAKHGLLMVMSIKIASVLCHRVYHRVSKEAVYTCEVLNSKIDNADRRWYSCDVIKTVRATEATGSVETPVQDRAITHYASFAAFSRAY